MSEEKYLEKLRDKIAIAALEAIISKPPLGTDRVIDGNEKEIRAARGAYSYADAMLCIMNE